MRKQQQQQLFYLAVCALSMFLMVRSFPRQAPSLASYTTTVQPFQHVPLKDTSESVANIEKELSSIAMLQRTLSFYSAAIPVFLSYKILGTSLKFRRDIMNEVVTHDEETKMFNDLHEWGSDVISNKIADLKGFYVKTGQIISTRVDIFPAQYTSKLAMTQDALDPLPIDVIRRIVSRELLDGGDLSDLFADFESTPLGSASVAQVHKATLLDGRVVAVKVQRPGIKSKLLGDIINLKNFAKAASKSLPLDYFKIFSEIERSLVYELDFLYEAQATAKVAAAVQHSPINEPQTPSVTVPLPIPGLVTTRVMVMEYIEGTPLSKVAAELSKRGVLPGSPESLLLGRGLLTALTDAYASMIFGSGIIHGDPHPGNIFVLAEGNVALLDCGQVKQLSTKGRMNLANLIIMINDWEVVNKRLGNVMRKQGQTSIDLDRSAEEVEEDKQTLEKLTKNLADTVRSYGLTFKEGARDDCAAAVAIVLFGNSDTILPGGYVGQETSPDSPIAQVAEFPSEFILLGRATVMIKGIANRLGLSWSLSDRWAKVARSAISASTPQQLLPIWSVATPLVATTKPNSIQTDVRRVSGKKRVRFADVTGAFVSWLVMVKTYLKKKVVDFIMPRLPEPVKRSLLYVFARLSAANNKRI